MAILKHYILTKEPDAGVPYIILARYFDKVEKLTGFNSGEQLY